MARALNESAEPIIAKKLAAIDSMCKSMRDPKIDDKRLDKLAANVWSLSVALHNDWISFHNMYLMVEGLEPDMKVIDG